MIPRVASRSLGEGLWVLTHAACYEKVSLAAIEDPTVGHQWQPPEAVAAKMKVTDEAFDAGFMRDPELCDHVVTTVPFDPKCKECRSAARRVLTERGYPPEQQQRLFAAVGAKWVWASAAKDRKKAQSDSSVAVLDPEGPGMVLESTLRARAARRAKKIADEDRDAAFRVRFEEAKHRANRRRA